MSEKEQPKTYTRSIQRAGQRASKAQEDVIVGKKQPQAIDVERQVIGGILIEPNVYGDIAEILKPETFYEKKHQLIYTAIVELAQKSDPIDFLTVGQQLAKDGTLEEAGGQNYLTELATETRSAAHIEYYSQLLANKSLARELITLGRSIEERAFDDTVDVDELMNSVEKDIFNIAQKSQKKDVQGMEDVVEDALQRLRSFNQTNAGGLTGVPTGFNQLDKMTSGWQPSDLIIIAARPAMGKTAFVLSMAKNMGLMGHPVAIFSLEMSNVQLVNRLIMNVCSIEGGKLRSGNLSKEDWSAIDHNISQLSQAPIYVDDTPGLSIFELKSKARRLKSEKKIECIVIDYLQLMSAGMKMQSRELEVSTISRSLKGLAKELQIPIIALSQLNRSLEGRTGVEGKVPQLSDLRESGAIEQDADMVCFIHRPEYFFGKGVDAIENADEKGKAHIIIAKHRNGSTGDVRLAFIGQYTRFDNEGDFSSTSPEGEGYSYQKVESGIVASADGYSPSGPLGDFAMSNNGAPF